MPDFYYEDFEPGSVLTINAESPIGKDAIIDFARAYDPQPFHLDEEAAKKSMLGGLSASGWHTCCIVMRLNYDHWLARTASMGAPGIEELRWAKPVRPGDVLSVRRTILDKRVSASRPDMGLVSMQCDVANQTGAIVLAQKHTQLIGVRHPRAASFSSTPASRPEKKAETLWPERKAALGTSRPFAGYFEDTEVGSYIEIGKEEFTRDSIIAFASLYDPQRFHMDEDEARNSHFGALAASGWQTAALWMRNIVRTRDCVHQELSSQGLKMPEGGPSPGFTALRWIKPVYVGDTITYATQVVEKRATSKPDWGLIFNRNTGTNQKGEIIFEFRGSAFVQKRP